MQSLTKIILIGFISFDLVFGNAIIGNGKVILGVRDEGNLIVDYEAVPSLGLPDDDPAGYHYIGLRTGYGDDNGDFESLAIGTYNM